MVPSSIMHYCWYCMPPILKSILHRFKTCQEKKYIRCTQGCIGGKYLEETRKKGQILRRGKLESFLHLQSCCFVEEAQPKPVVSHSGFVLPRKKKNIYLLSMKSHLKGCVVGA